MAADFLGRSGDSTLWFGSVIWIAFLVWILNGSGGDGRDFRGKEREGCLGEEMYVPSNQLISLKNKTKACFPVVIHANTQNARTISPSKILGKYRATILAINKLNKKITCTRLQGKKKIALTHCAFYEELVQCSLKFDGIQFIFIILNNL